MSDNPDRSSPWALIFCLIIAAIAYVIFFTALFLVAPGAAIAAVVASLLGKEIDAGQAWTFAILASVMVACGYHVYFRNPEATQKAYLLTCAMVGVIYAVSSFGFHAQWADTHIGYFVPSWNGKKISSRSENHASSQHSSGQSRMKEQSDSSEIRALKVHAGQRNEERVNPSAQDLKLTLLLPNPSPSPVCADA